MRGREDAKRKAIVRLRDFLWRDRREKISTMMDAPLLLNYFFNFYPAIWRLTRLGKSTMKRVENRRRGLYCAHRAKKGNSSAREMESEE